MVHKVWYRIAQDGRAPGSIKMSEYEEGPSVNIRSRNSAPYEVSRISDDPTTKNRAIRIGDVMEDESGNYYIYTPTFQWALVYTID